MEIGACYGYNLDFIKNEIGGNVHGVEPSEAAVKYGNKKYMGRVDLRHGTSDNLPYEDEKFDIVIMGFCMFWVDRKYLMRTVAEADRVLRENGYLVIIDFDTAIPYKRDNKHNSAAWTYKMNYVDLFLANPQYYLVDKRSFSHTGLLFSEDVQERIMFNVLYKESVEDAYVRG